MDMSQSLNARQLADATGLRSMDFDGLKPGMPRTSGPVKISVAADGIMAIDATDKEGNRLGLRVRREGDNFNLMQGDFAPRQGTASVLQKPDDLAHVAGSIQKMKLGQEPHAVAALTQTLQESRALKPGSNALDWSFGKSIEHFKATADQPMRFERPAHMPASTSQHDINRYHLGNGFIASTAPDGGRLYTYVTDTTDKEKLVLSADKDGQIKKVQFNGKDLPASRETQATVVSAARDAAGSARRGDVRNNPNISSTLSHLLNNDFRHHGLEGGRGVGAYVQGLGARTATPAVAAPVVAQAAAPAKPAIAPAAPARPASPSPVSAFNKQRGRAGLGGMLASFAISTVAAVALSHKDTIAEKLGFAKPEANAVAKPEVDMSVLSRSLTASPLQPTKIAEPNVSEPVADMVIRRPEAVRLKM